MKILNKYAFPCIFITILLFNNCKTNKQWEGQGSIKKVNTESVPIQLQYKGIFNLGNGIYCSNDFDGARLNGVALTKDTIITVLIAPENMPINGSPWYAFKLWSDKQQSISLRLTYPKGISHRYYPQVSSDGTQWERLDPSKYSASTSQGPRPASASMSIRIGPDTLWIAAQEMITTRHAECWMEKIADNSFVTKNKIGESTLGKPIHALKIGQSENEQVVVILARQHPPEITGFLAMQAFVETICSDVDPAVSFRNRFNSYVVPVVNPDGVDAGHWRHNVGGIDLNRDWSDFNQPETTAIRDYIKQIVDSAGGKVVFFIDFHSTWEDIYYVNHDKESGNIPGLAHKLIELTGEEFPDYTPNVKNLLDGSNSVITSDNYFYSVYGAQAITYEVGDNTPRDFIRKKAEVTAVKLMELLNDAF